MRCSDFDPSCIHVTRLTILISVFVLFVYRVSTAVEETIQRHAKRRRRSESRDRSRASSGKQPDDNKTVDSLNQPTGRSSRSTARRSTRPPPSPTATWTATGATPWTAGGRRRYPQACPHAYPTRHHRRGCHPTACPEADHAMRCIEFSYGPRGLVGLRRCKKISRGLEDSEAILRCEPGIPSTVLNSRIHVL